MPRFFFHVHDGVDLRDEEGTELPDIYVAQAQAIRMSGEILRDKGVGFWDGTEWKLEVTDQHGNVILLLRFSAEELPILPNVTGLSFP
jgi:hypothetical protein